MPPLHNLVQLNKHCCAGEQVRKVIHFHADHQLVALDEARWPFDLLAYRSAAIPVMVTSRIDHMREEIINRCVHHYAAGNLIIACVDRW
jgi:hypothetical protein